MAFRPRGHSARQAKALGLSPCSGSGRAMGRRNAPEPMALVSGRCHHRRSSRCGSEARSAACGRKRPGRSLGNPAVLRNPRSIGLTLRDDVLWHHAEKVESARHEPCPRKSLSRKRLSQVDESAGPGASSGSWHGLCPPLGGRCCGRVSEGPTIEHHRRARFQQRSLLHWCPREPTRVVLRNAS
jgi:hypothetical protein